MVDGTAPVRAPVAELGRRAWLSGALTAWIGAPGLVKGSAGADDHEAEEERAIQDVARRAGLRPFRTSRTGHFFGIGDAPNGFRSLTLRDSEVVTADYMDHYRAKGFEVSLPERRLTVVTLADDRSFAAYSGNPDLGMALMGKDPSPEVHGYYSPRTNRLVVFDHRSLGPQLEARPGPTNLRVLAHELTYQLTCNTGLLDREGDVPACIAEGLAMYGEVRKSDGRTAPGQLNRMRVTDLTRLQRRKISWISVSRLIEDDTWARNAATRVGLLAYAENWLLVDYLMKDKSRLPSFRAYLAANQRRRGNESRLDVARTHLGDLNSLDENLRRYSIRLLKDHV